MSRRMKTCFTLENQMSPSVYETVNFSRVIERLAGFSGDVCGNQGGRDMGLQVGGELFKTSVDDYFLEYRAGVYNGSGLSMKDHNDAKDFAAWFTVQPVKGLKPLSRFGIGYIPQPGGDKIGRRRLDTHFIGLQKLGATFNYNPDELFYSVEASKLKGTYMLLDEASVTGTANIVMAASMAEGTTTIYNAACEPYLQQLCKMLVSMGAIIEGIGSNLLTVKRS